jgi:hypothetical protein
MDCRFICFFCHEEHEDARREKPLLTCVERLLFFFILFVLFALFVVDSGLKHRGKSAPKS